MKIKPYWNVYMEEAAAGDEGAAAGSETIDPGTEGAQGGEGGESQGTMLDAINEALQYTGPAAEEKAAAEAQAAEEQALADRDAQAAAGDAEAIRAKQEAAAQADAAKPKDLKALELTPADKLAMKPATAARYEQVLTAVKEERTAREAAEVKVQGLEQAREGIMSVLRETNTSDADLAQLLEFNRLVKSGTPQGYEQALAVINQQRTTLMKMLGHPSDGYDPLTEHQDLAAAVTENKMTREGALEIAASRRREAINQHNANRGAQQEQSQARQQEAVKGGMAAIEQWAAGMAKSDIDYKAKEEKILAEITGIVREYPPNLWLPTIKRLYGGIVISKAATLPARGNQPLRASGAKPGAPAPTSMMQAIDQKLGYAK